ncbi:MAG: alpha-D-ribose 1-methylphosphonate 5-triphosphate diphosphatase [Pseudomonadota bacterium]
MTLPPDPNSDESKAARGTLCLARARLVLSDCVMRGHVVVQDGVIVEISEGDQVPKGATDCAGDYVMPGLIELHTDNLERHMEPRPGVDWPHLPALVAHDAELASTGITTVFDALRVGSLPQSKAGHQPYARALANELQEARGAGFFKINHFLHLRAEICSETLLPEMAEFGAADRVGVVSLMDHTPGQRQFRDLTALRLYLTKGRAMSEEDFAAHVAMRQEVQRIFGEKNAVGAVAEANRYGAVLASHDDTSVEEVVTSARNGVRFAEFPTTLAAAQACRAAGIAVMMGGPNIVRGGSHSGNVSAHELAEAGLLDIISSDYVPAALLMSAFQLAAQWQDLPRAIACVTANPAAAAGLTDRGRLAPGLRGDLVRVRAADRVALVTGVWNAGRRVG